METQTLAMRGRRDRTEVEEEEDLAAASEMVLCIENTLCLIQKLSNRPTSESVAFHKSSRRREIFLLMAEMSGKEILKGLLSLWGLSA